MNTYSQHPSNEADNRYFDHTVKRARDFPIKAIRILNNWQPRSLHTQKLDLQPHVPLSQQVQFWSVLRRCEGGGLLTFIRGSETACQHTNQGACHQPGDSGNRQPPGRLVGGRRNTLAPVADEIRARAPETEAGIDSVAQDGHQRSGHWDSAASSAPGLGFGCHSLN